MSRATRKPLLIRCRAFQNTGLVSSPISPLDCKSRVQWRKEHTLCQCGLSDLNYTRIRMEARPPMFCSIAPITEGFDERSVNLYLCLVMATNHTLRAKQTSLDKRCILWKAVAEGHQLKHYCCPDVTESEEPVGSEWGVSRWFHYLKDLTSVSPCHA